MSRQAELDAMSYGDYLKTGEWDTKRTAARAYAQGACQVCNTSDGPLYVHHRNYDDPRGQEQPQNLTLLCEPCHRLATAKVRGWDIQVPDDLMDGPDFNTVLECVPKGDWAEMSDLAFADERTRRWRNVARHALLVLSLVLARRTVRIKDKITELEDSDERLTSEWNRVIRTFMEASEASEA